MPYKNKEDSGVNRRKLRAANRGKRKIHQAKYYAANSEKIKSAAAKYRAANSEKIKSRMAKYRAANSEKYAAYKAKYRVANPDKIKAAKAKYCTDPKNRAAILVVSARTRARNKNLPFNLDNHVEEIRERLAAGVCELSGIPFTWKRGGDPRSPSLDRRIPKLGYIYSNIRIICWCLNTAFGSWGENAAAPILEAFLKTTRILEYEGSDAA